MDDYGQVSAEMIVLLAAVIAVAYVIVKSLYGTASDAKHSFTSASNKTLDKVNDIMKI